MKKNTLKYVLFFFTFLLILHFLTPISGDDYGCYNGNSGTLIEAFKTAKGMYFYWEGRFVGRMVISLLVYYKSIFNIITSFLICVMFIIGVKLMGEIKNKGIYFLLFISLMLLNCDMFAQVYTWVAGSVTYLYPTVIMLMYFSYIYFKRDKKFKWYDYLIFLIVNIIGTMFVENVGCSLVVGNFLLMLYFLKRDKRKFYTFLGCFIISSISLSIMLLSPGSAARSAQNVEFNNLSLFEKIYGNLENLIKYLFTRNLMLLFLMLVVINYVFKKKKLNIFLIILFNIIPVISIIQNIGAYSPIDIWFLKTEVLTIIDFSSTFYILYWIVFLFVFLYSLYQIFKKEQERLLFFYFLIFVSLVSTLVMLILSTWGDRVTFFAVITLTIISVVAINEIIENRFNKTLTVLGCLVILYYLFFFLLIYVINEKRVSDIQVQVNEGKNEIEVLKNPVYFLWNNNLPGDYFVWTYKEYLGLDKSTSLNLYRLTYKEYVLLLFK